jgi:hypothetical protein
MGDLFVSGAVTAEVTFDNPATCGTFNSDELQINNLRMKGEVRGGVRFVPSPLPLVLHCWPAIAFVASIKPVADIEVTGSIKLRRGRDWTTTGNMSAPHYEISSSNLTYERFDMSGADPYTEPLRDFLFKPRILDEIDNAVSDESDRINCLCEETAPANNTYPVYVKGYDPR